jgi:hypothetical protein
MKEWTTINKSDWGDGPWQNEPDKVVWIDPVTNLDCMIHRGPSGALCGYVGVGPDHPWHGKGCDDVDVEVHGGLTFANKCNEEATEANGICHIPEPGRPHDVWWLGFDCAHAFDVMPRLRRDELDIADQLETEGKYKEAALFRRGITNTDGPFRSHYRDIAYVTAEVTSLAQQAREAAISG